MAQSIDVLHQHVRKAYFKLATTGMAVLIPAKIADSAYMSLDPDSVAPLSVRWGCVLQLRQIARRECARLHDPKQVVLERNEEELDLFSEMLQDRYPAKRNGDEVYVLREALTVDERYRVIGRMKRCGKALVKHADALQKETETLVNTGSLRKHAAA